MRRRLLATRLAHARGPWHWDFANGVLYRLCKRNPGHSDPAITIAKIWLIGRSYAAAIERAKTRQNVPPDFYANRVARIVCGSKIDSWFASLSRHRRLDHEALLAAIEVHGKVTRLFSRVSGENKRSLASKYLHFHFPHLFFLYDSRATTELRTFSSTVGRVRHTAIGGDTQYGVFAEKCFRLQRHIRAKYRVSLTPRQLDRLLLGIADERAA